MASSADLKRATSLAIARYYDVLPQLVGALQDAVEAQLLVLRLDSPNPNLVQARGKALLVTSDLEDKVIMVRSILADLQAYRDLL